jgi:acetyl-CoA acetyltransferase
MSRDRVAIVGVGSVGYTRDPLAARSAAGLACDAAMEALADAGLQRSDIDGIAGTSVPTATVQAALGIPEVGWWANTTPPFGLALAEAVQAVHTGTCTTALVYHSTFRGQGASRAAAADPYRSGGSGDPHGHNVGTAAETPTGTLGYAFWAGRYLHDHGVGREVLGAVARNGRANAETNERAVFRDPLSEEQYLGARMIREPLCLYDMDPPVDSGDAFVVTTLERAADLGVPAAVVHALSFGRTDRPYADQMADLGRTGSHVAAQRLWAQSDIRRPDVDLLYLYDGFSIMALVWLESLGWAAAGRAGDLLRDSAAPSGRVCLDGRVPVNTHGGSLSEGASQGAGHVREAVTQLRGRAGPRQVRGVTTALVTTGGFLWNATAMLLRASS